MPPKHAVNAPTRLMRDLGYSDGYVYDPDTEEGFSGLNYFPDDVPRQVFYQPGERGFEREIRKRLDYWAKICAPPNENSARIGIGLLSAAVRFGAGAHDANENCSGGRDPSVLGGRRHSRGAVLCAAAAAGGNGAAAAALAGRWRGARATGAGTGGPMSGSAGAMSTRRANTRCGFRAIGMPGRAAGCGFPATGAEPVGRACGRRLELRRQLMTGVRTIAVDRGRGRDPSRPLVQAAFSRAGHGRLEKLLRTGQVRLDGKRAAAGRPRGAGPTVRVPPLGAIRRAAAQRPTARRCAPADRRCCASAVLTADDDVIVIDKPAGLAVQGGTGTARHLDGMLDALRIRRCERPRLVHRLDKDTSGVLVLARSARAAAKLAAGFPRQGRCARVYWAATHRRAEAAPGPDRPAARQAAGQTAASAS